MTPLAPLALFGAGLASCLTPCVLPLVPVYVAMLLATASERRARVARATAAFVAGFTAVFVTLGVLSGLLGAGIGAVQGWAIRIGGGLVVGFGLMLVVPMPLGWNRTLRFVRTLPDVGNRWRPLALGSAFGAAWTPCAGPLLGAAAVAAAGSGSAASGALLLAAYALGVATPFLATSLLVAWTGEAASTWPARLAPVSRALQYLAGAVLIAIGATLVAGVYP